MESTANRTKDLFNSLTENGVYIDVDGNFSLNPTVEDILPLTANMVEQQRVKYLLELNGGKHKHTVRVLGALSEMTLTIRRIIGLKAPLYNRLKRGIKARIWMLDDLNDLHTVINVTQGAREKAIKAMKLGKMSLDDFFIIEKISPYNISYGIVNVYTKLTDEAKGDIRRAYFEQSFYNGRKYEHVTIYCLVKPKGKKWEVIHAEYQNNLAPKHVGRTKLTHGLCFY